MAPSSSSRVESVFFGGGTPSLASPHTVAAVLEAVAQEAHLPADSEVTLEANPTSAPGSRLAGFGAAGVNRLSIGLQVTHLTHPVPVPADPKVAFSHWENISGYQVQYTADCVVTLLFCLLLYWPVHFLRQALGSSSSSLVVVVVVF